MNTVTLNKTWLRTETEKYIDIPGYDWIGKSRKRKKGGSIGILISSNQKYRHRADLELMDPQFEHLVVELKVNEGSVLIVSLYRPPNTDQSNWINSYKELIIRLKKCYYRIFLGMDHNLDLLKFEKHKTTQEFLE